MQRRESVSHSADCVRLLTFVHRDFNRRTIGTDIVAADTHVRAGVRHLDVGDEQRTNVCAVHAGLQKTNQGRIQRYSQLTTFC